MGGSVLLGCSGWNYGDTPDKGGWTGVFYQGCCVCSAYLP